MSDAKNLKSCLLEEAKKDEWRKNINDEEYVANKDLIDQVHEKNLEKIADINRRFKYKKIDAKQSSVSRKISDEAKLAYEKWKENNPREVQCPEVPVQNLLNLIHYLNAEPNEAEQNELCECLKRQNSDYETFWDSPRFVLKVLRRCVLTRDWDNMTYFLLILLNYDTKYLPIVKNMCQIMVKYYCLVKECDLEDQFNALLAPQPETLEIV